jgi:peroxiredoxin
LPQDWINDLFKQGLTNPNDIVATLRTEMEKAVGKKAPTLTFQSIDQGSADSLAAYLGKVVIVNFWKTNCSGCRIQLPQLSRLQQTYSDQGLAVIYISPDDSSTLANFFAQHKTFGFRVTMSSKELTRPFQLLATPSAFLADKEGTIREVWIGPETFDALEKRVLPYLASK